MAKKAAKQAAAPVKTEAKKGRYEVVRRLCEAGEVYLPGEKVTRTPNRASALGSLVKPASES